MVAPRGIALAFLFLCTVLAAFTEARATPTQAQEQPAPPDAVTLPPLVPAEPAPEPGPTLFPEKEPEREYQPRSRPSVAQPFRGLLESLGAGVTGAAGGFAGMLVGKQFFDCDDDGCIGPILLGGMAGAAVGIPLGVFASGRLMGVRGGLGGAYLGLLIGGGSTTLLGLLLQNDGDGTAFIPVPIGCVLGAVVGFELSDDSRSLDTYSDVRGPVPGFSLTPTMGTTPRGGFVGGFSGRF
jgi:hypothetical protein